jgi:guanylate kinase
VTATGSAPARLHRLLIVVSAPSGAGKTSLCEWAVRAVPGLVHSVSFTTRPPRPDEQDGTDYHFVDEAAFRGMVERGDFAEWAQVHGHLYGTSRLLLEQHFAAGLDVILDLDTQGAAILRRVHPDGVFVFIVPPSWAQLEARLRRRKSDSEAAIQRRLGRAREEIAEYLAYQYVIVNDEFDRAAEHLKAIILAERCRRVRVDLTFLHA